MLYQHASCFLVKIIQFTSDLFLILSLTIYFLIWNYTLTNKSRIKNGQYKIKFILPEIPPNS